MLTDPTRPGIRIGEGGLLRGAEARCRLTTLRRQILGVLVIAWVPLVVVGLLRERATGHEAPLLRSAVMHVRLLVAAPLLLLLDALFPNLCRYVLEQLLGNEIVPTSALPRFERALRSATRLSDASLPELVLAVASLGLGISALFGVVSISGIEPSSGLDFIQVWYALVALPLFDFLLLRALWRWVIWVHLLVGLSRIDLAIDPLHPDGHGGLDFLRWPSLTYGAMLLFVVASVLCAEWDARFTLGNTLSSFAPPLLLFTLCGTVVAFGPLLLFVPVLARARRDGLIEMSAHATRADRSFQRDRIRSGSAEATVVTPEVQSLAALAETFQNVVRCRVVLFGRRDLIVVLIATLLPMLPLVLASVPRAEWMAMAGIVTGTLPVGKTP